MRFIPLFLICLVACLLCIDTTGRFTFHCLISPLLTAFFISWPTKFLPHRIRESVQFIIGELFILICLVDCYCQEILFTPITPQILSNVFLSNLREINEFCSTFIGFYVLSYWRISALLLLCLILPIGLLYNHGIPELCYFGRKCSGRKFLILLLMFCIACEIQPSYRFVQLFYQHRDLQNMEGLIFRHYHEEIPTPLHRFVFACYSLKQSSYVLDKIKASTFSVQIDSCSYQSPHIVLVIGESYNKHHSTLYGYQLPTTPLQQKRNDNAELFVFDNVVSPWNITSNVFLDIFSVWEYGMTTAIDEMPLFPILFRRAGYSVNFFSNQYLLNGFRKGTTNQAGHFFLADSEMSDSLFTYRNRRSGKFDLGLVEQVKHFKNEHQLDSYTLDIIHLIGQHFEYSLRYPQTVRAFSMKNYADKNIDDDAKEIIMQYDNATHYNDIVLDSILAMYDYEEAIVIYVADHGEEVYDELPVHGRLFQEPTKFQAKNEFEVPMWIWCSRSYQEKHPDIVAAIRSSTSKEFLTDGLSQVLLYLAGIKCKWSNENRNILSPRYQSKQRIIGGSVDYDNLMK